MQPTLYIDLRCLQDPNYRVRGIGQHISALLRTRAYSGAASWRTIGLTDPNSPKLPEELHLLVDEVTSSANPSYVGEPAVFVDGTPMTHDTHFSLRFENHLGFFRAAVMYDFIPLDWPGYLPTVASRMAYIAKMARLRKFDLFLPISDYTARRMSELLGVTGDRLRVTGAPVRRKLYELRKYIGDTPSDNHGQYFLIVVAGDPRKNPEVAVEAVRRLNLYNRRIVLKVVGHYDEGYKYNLLRLAGHQEGAGFLEFHSGISDEELVSLYTGAIATIASSHIEGFSLPVVEAAVCGCPVVASNCTAHLELIDQAEALFPSHDSQELAGKLEAIAGDLTLRNSLVKSQAHLALKFREEAVGQRFWSAIESGVLNHHNPVFGVKSRRPHLAFLSPFPPDQAGPAFYTANTIRASERLFRSDLYTDAPRPLTFEGNFADAGGVSLAPLLNGRYDAVISVLGNSLFHARVFEFFERYGGPCILHDARLVQIYFQRLGQEQFIKMAARLLGRDVAMDEVNTWLQDRELPLLFLEPIMERASPLIVHTVTQQTEIKRRYGVDAHVTTCCPTHFFRTEELGPSSKNTARERIAVKSGTFLVSSFGIVDKVKGMESCVLAAEILRSWNIPVELYFVGAAGGDSKQRVAQIARTYGMAQYVHCFDSFVDDKTYRTFLMASDAAVQLRTYAFGQLSAALTDCISAGIPSVASRDLAESCDAPEYVSRVPDRFSPLQVAEQLASIWEKNTEFSSRMELRANYMKIHNFEYYGRRLLEILGVS